MKLSDDVLVILKTGLTATGGLDLGSGGTAIGMAAGVATGIAYDGIVTLITGKKDGGCFAKQDATKAPLSACSSICVTSLVSMSASNRIVMCKACVHVPSLQCAAHERACTMCEFTSLK